MIDSTRRRLRTNKRARNRRLTLEALEDRRLLATDLTVLKADTLTIDADSDQAADPGDQIRYAVDIWNLGTEDALDAVFDDQLDPNTTFVDHSLSITPLAVDDQYFTSPGSGLSIGAGMGLLANDFDIDGSDPGGNADLTVTGVNRTSGDLSGALNVNADGSFTYQPPLGERGVETFDYTIQDADALESLVAGTLTFTVSSNIWFVDNSLPTNGDGSLSNPFNTLADVNGAGGGGDVDAEGDFIFVFAGNGTYDGGLELEDGQQLIGQRAGLTIGSTELVAPGPGPVITNSASGGAGITLAGGNTIRGLDIAGPLGAGISGTGLSGSFTFDDLRIDSAGDAGIDIDSSSGTFTFTDIEISEAEGDGIEIGGSSGGFTFQDIDIDIPDATGIDIGTSAGTFTFSDVTVTGPGQDGVEISDAGGTFTFDNLDIDAPAEAGIDLDTTTGTFTFSSTDIDDAGQDGVRVQNLQTGGSVEFNGSIRSFGLGDLIDIVDTAPNTTIEFNTTGSNELRAVDGGGISIIGIGGQLTVTTPVTIDNGLNNPFLTGISVFDSDGEVSFSDTSVLNQTGLNAAVEVLANDGVVEFHNLNITTNDTSGGAVGFQVAGSNEVAVTGNSNVHANGGAAIELVNANTIDLTFNNVSASDTVDEAGKRNGVSILNVGGGSLQVNGSVIMSNIEGNGFFIDNAAGSYVFRNLDINGVGDDGASVGVVFPNPGNVHFDGGAIRNVGSQGLRLEDTSVLIDDLTLEGLPSEGIDYRSTVPGLRRIGISNVTVGSGADPAAQQGIVLDISDGVVLAELFGSEVFADGNAVEAITGGADDLCLDMSANTLASGASSSDIRLQQTGGSTLGITQQTLAQLQSDNGGASLSTSGIIALGCVTPGESESGAGTGSGAEGDPGAQESPQDAPQNAESGGFDVPITIGTLPSGKAVRIVFDVEVNDPLPPGTLGISNQATITGGNFAPVLSDDPETANADDATRTPVDLAQPTADLSLSVEVDNLSPAPPTPVTFQFTVTNSGPSDATGVEVTAAAMPPGDVLNSSASAGTFNDQTGVWTVGQLAAGASAMLEVTILVTVESSSYVAQVTASDQFDPDSTPGNSDPTEDDQVLVELGRCLTSDGPLMAGVNRLIYSCATPGSVSAFAVGHQVGSTTFAQYDVTIEIADPEIFALGIADLDGVTVVYLELSEQQAAQAVLVQAFEISPGEDANVSNLVTRNLDPQETPGESGESEPAFPWHNAVLAADVDGSGRVDVNDLRSTLAWILVMGVELPAALPTPNDLLLDVSPDNRVDVQDLRSVLATVLLEGVGTAGAEAAPPTTSLTAAAVPAAPRTDSTWPSQVDQTLASSDIGPGEAIHEDAPREFQPEAASKTDLGVALSRENHRWTPLLDALAEDDIDSVWDDLSG